MTLKHEEVILELPWYLNGTLEPARHELIGRHLAGCSQCSRELEELQTLSAAEISLSSRAPEPPNDLLDRVFERIDASEAQVRTGDGALEPLRSWLAQWWQPMPAMGRALVLAQAVLLVVLGGALLRQTTDSELETAAGGLDAHEGVRFEVRFEAAVTIGEIEELLREHGLEVVRGPSALGVFELELTPAPGGARSVLEQLRLDDRVEYAELEP